MTTVQAKALLKAFLPPGFVDWFDFSPGSFGDLVLEAAAEQFAPRIDGTTSDAEANNNPWTLIHSGLSDWEVALGIASLSTSSDAARAAAIVSKVRQNGASTLDNIRSIVGPLLGYSNPTQLQIIETNRSTLEALHTYENGSGISVTASSTTRTIAVGDNAPASQFGARLAFDNFSVTDPNDWSITLQGPDSTTKTISNDPSMVRNGSDPQYFYFPGFSGLLCDGVWTVTVQSVAGTVTADDVKIYVEGIGRSVQGRIDGLGAQIFYWSVVVDPALEGVAHASDRNAAIVAIEKIAPAHTLGGLVLKQSDGVLCALVDDPNAIADMCVAC